MSRKTLLQHLDDSVEWTGIPALASKRPRRRPLRWLSTASLALAAFGFFAGFGQPGRWWGYAFLMLGFVLGNMMPVWGPIKQWGSVEHVDEFDRVLRARAFLAAFTGLSAVAVLSLLLIVGLSTLQDWTTGTLRSTIMQLALLLAAIYSAGPTCYASWAQAPIRDDE